MSTLAEVTTQPTTDPNVKVWHTRHQMTSGPEAGSRGSIEYLGEFGRMILDIEGVVEIQIIPYTALIKKALLFEWEEINPKVDALLGEFVKSQHQLMAVVDGPRNRD